MSANRLVGASSRLSSALGGSTRLSKDPLMRCLAPSICRSLSTETPMGEPTVSPITTDIPSQSSSLLAANFPLRRPPPAVPEVLTTIYSFPTMEPLRFEQYSAQHLDLPLRRDILHRAVIFEGDSERQGTASTKWRREVHGSTRKLRPQKGTGRARLGDKKSPMLVGGGVAFGPKPRDFSTKLPKKVYDLAWRTALSYRYRRGQLVVVEDGVELDDPEPRWLMKILQANKMGHSHGRSLIITEDLRPNLWAAAAGAPRQGEVMTTDEVDVKNLLEMGRLVVEKSALDTMLTEHSSDLDKTLPSAVY